MKLIETNKPTFKCSNCGEKNWTYTELFWYCESCSYRSDRRAVLTPHLKLYMLVDPHGLYLAAMSKYHRVDDEYKIPTYGTVIPGLSGNYYDQLIISPTRRKGELEYTMGIEGWLEWFINDALPNKWAAISKEYWFDPKELKVVEFNEGQRYKIQ